MPVAASVTTFPSGPVIVTVAVGTSWLPQETWTWSRLYRSGSDRRAPLGGHQHLQVGVGDLALAVGQLLEGVERLVELVAGEVEPQLIQSSP